MEYIKVPFFSTCMIICERQSYSQEKKTYLGLVEEWDIGPAEHSHGNLVYVSLSFGFICDCENTKLKNLSSVFKALGEFKIQYSALNELTMSQHLSPRITDHCRREGRKIMKSQRE